MRKWMVLSVVAAFLFIDVLPLLAANIEVDGNFRVRGFYTDNLTDAYDSGTTGVTCGSADCNDSTAYNTTRFMMRTKATAGIATGVVEIHFTSAGNTGNLRFGEDPGAFGPKDDRFALHQAYIEGNLQLATLAAGRKLFILGHSIILDDPGDGFFLVIPLGPAVLSVSNLKVADNTDLSVVPIGNAASGSGTGDDTDLYVGNLNFRPSDELDTNLFIGYYNNRGPNYQSGISNLISALGAPVTDFDLIIVGGTADAHLGPLTVGGEIDFLTGTISRTGLADVDLEGLNVEVFGGMDVGPARVGLTFLYASGQDPTKTGTEINVNGIDGNYPTGIILTNGGARSLAPKDGTCLGVTSPSLPTSSNLDGVPNCVGSSGLLAIKATGSMMPMERVTLQGDLIYARSAEDPSTTNSDKDIGIEIDGTAKFQLDENFSILAGVGYLITGDFWKATSASPDTDNMVVGVLELSFVF